MSSLSDRELRSLVRKLLPTILHTPTFEEQGKYIVILGDSRDERCIVPLARMLSHRDRNMRILVINAIKKINSPTTMHVIEHCLIDEDETVREAARVAICETQRRAWTHSLSDV
jgi:HEAT repeat protein